jgi:hypothetical protein
LKKLLGSSLLALSFIWVLAPLYADSKEKLPSLRPLKTETPPVIDGVLDDPVWKVAPHETGFKTWTPDYGIDMKENTVVYYAYDRENLYFAFRCFDSEPNKIKASITGRDTIRADDWICVNLDSFNDRQSLYAFYVNPLGIQQDSRFEGNKEDFTVDAVWFSAGKINAEGYAAELQIPFKSIRYSDKNPVEMGVIFERKVSRQSEGGTYPPLDPVQGQNFLTQTRPLLLYDIKHYRLFELLPGITYGRRSSLDQGNLIMPRGKGDLSLTTKYGLTSQLILDGTLNPDFSQIEADAGQVDFNLRYSLFFPEKRPFFLEGIEKFNFAGHVEGDPIGAVVYTRTIVDPLVGIKLNGRVSNKDMLASIYALDDLLEGDGEKYAHFSILRYKRALGQDGFLGGFFTGRTQGKTSNVVAGTDGQFRLNPSSFLGYHVFLSQTKPEGPPQKMNGYASSLHYEYQTRNLFLRLGFQDISKDFITEVGYVTRTGITRFRAGIMPMIYPGSSLILRIDPVVHSYQVRDKFSGLYETDNSFDLRFILPRNSSFMIGGSYATEVFLGERFGRNTFRMTATTQFTKQLFLNLTFKYGKKIRYIQTPYQGNGSDVSATMSYLPSEKLHFDLNLTYSDFFRSADSRKEYDYGIFWGRTTYQVNKYLFFRGIVEYNSFWKRLITDFLASFTYIPGTVIHFGYGSLYEKIEWRDGDYVSADRFLETKRGFFFKASYLWRF